MDSGALAIMCGILASGFALGMTLSRLGPRDEEAAEVHGQLARRAQTRVPRPMSSKRVRAQPKPGPAFH